MQVEFIWALKDLFSCIFIIATAIMIFAAHKKIMWLFSDFWYRHDSAIKAVENLDPVISCKHLLGGNQNNEKKQDYPARRNKTPL